MTNDAIIGISPGLKRGAVVVARKLIIREHPWIGVAEAAEFVRTTVNYFKETGNRTVKAVIENRSARGTGMGAQYTSMGIWIGILAANEVPFELVSMQRWKRHFLNANPKMSEYERKTLSRKLWLPVPTFSEPCIGEAIVARYGQEVTWKEALTNG